MDLSLEELTGKSWDAGKGSPSRANTVVEVSFPMMDDHVPSCPSFSPGASVTQGNESGGPANSFVRQLTVGEEGRGKGAW